MIRHCPVFHTSHPYSSTLIPGFPWNVFGTNRTNRALKGVGNECLMTEFTLLLPLKSWKRKKWNNQTYNILKHQTNVLGVKVNIIIPILRFRFWGQGMCFHPCCIWYCNLWCSNRKRCSPGSLPRAAPFLFPNPPVKCDNCYSPRFLCCVYLNIRLYWKLNVDAYLKQLDTCKSLYCKYTVNKKTTVNFRL